MAATAAAKSQKEMHVGRLSARCTQPISGVEPVFEQKQGRGSGCASMEMVRVVEGTEVICRWGTNGGGEGAGWKRSGRGWGIWILRVRADGQMGAKVSLSGVMARKCRAMAPYVGTEIGQWVRRIFGGRILVCL